MAKKRIIECSVNDEYVLGSGVVVGAAGSHDDVVLRLTFGEMWIGLNIYATFRDARGEHPTLVPILPSMLVDGEVMVYDVPVPAAAKRHPGQMMLTLTGYSIVDGVQEDSATNTATAYFRVLQSDFALLDDGSVDATLAERFLDEFNAMDKRFAEYEKVVSDEFERVESEANADKAELEGKISAGLGKQGAVEIPADAWSEAVAIVSVADAGANDMIIFSPATESDKTTLNNCGVFISPVVNEGIVRLSCRVKPTVAISLVYFITRGAE